MLTQKMLILKKLKSMDSGYCKLNKKLEEEGKKLTFRIAHMGDLTIEGLKEFTSKLEEYWK